MEISGNIIDILNNRIFPGKVRFENGIITDIKSEDQSYSTYILPGFIDAHCHVESSLLCPSEFARIASTHGTVACISDPHEIANVLGVEGVDLMIENGKRSNFKFFFGAPSCVPATELETSGAAIDARALDMLLGNPEIKYLSEMMNFQGVINKDPTVMEKISIARRHNKPIDGHAPGLRGEALKKYINAGITTDHETYGYDEGEEKISLGMKLIIREGSASKNFDTLSALIEKYPHMCMLCSDDKHPDDLVKGHINLIVKRAVSSGIDLFKVLRCACINPRFHYNLDVGILNVGDRADFIEVDNLEDLNVIRTFINGEIAGENNSPLLPSVEPICKNRFEVKQKVPSDFSLSGCDEKTVNVIEAINRQVVTGWLKLSLKPLRGFYKPDISQDILKLTLVCRYSDKPPVVGFVKNFGLKKGAIASSVAHDSHNIVAVGTNDEDICRAVNLIIEKKGGLSIASDTILEILPLPLGGLMAVEDGWLVAEKYSRLDGLAKKLGSSLDSPFMTLSFMALPVIPRLKITDKGLYDVSEGRFIGLFE